MPKQGYSEVVLNDFLLNAGVIGFLRACILAEKNGEDCRKGRDYLIDGQSLYISNDFLLREDIGGLFVRAMVETFGPETKYMRILAQKSLLDKLYESPKPEDKEWRKKADEVYKTFIDMMEKNSFKSGYVILAKCKDVTAPTEAMLQTLKSEKDYQQKKKRYDELQKILVQPKVRYILTFKDILYSLINMFYADNKGNGVAFLSKREIEPAEAFNADFMEPLRAELTQKPEKNTMTCISCGAEVDGKNAISITKFVDSADDLGKKKSYYWNNVPDAYLCPVCAMICAMAPLGFTYFGDDGLFVNNNSDVNTLLAFSNLVVEGKTEDKPDRWYTLCNVITSDEMKYLQKRADNIQVVARSRSDAKYHLNTIDRRTIGVLKESSKDLEYLKSRFVKDGKDHYINVYQSAVENVVLYRNQYPLITHILRATAAEETQKVGYLFHILLIQIRQKGGNKVSENVKRAYVAKLEGEKLRAKVTEGLAERDKDNKLRGLVYQMLNAVSLGNRDKFMELVLRTYSGYNLPVPDIFFACFSSDDDFKETGFAFLLGMKSDGFKKEGDNEK